MDYEDTLSALVGMVGQPVGVSAPWPAPDAGEPLEDVRRRLLALVDTELQVVEEQVHYAPGRADAVQLADLARAAREIAAIPGPARPYVQTVGVLTRLEETDPAEGRERLTFRLGDNASFVLDREEFLDAETDDQGSLRVVTRSGAMLLQLADTV